MHSRGREKRRKVVRVSERREERAFRRTRSVVAVFEVEEKGFEVELLREGGSVLRRRAA